MAFTKGILIIAHPDCPVSKLSHVQIRDYYLKRNRAWADNTSVRFFDRPETTEVRKIFLENFLHRTSRQVDRFWIEQKFKSGDSAPSSVANDVILLDLISRFPGSISYISDEVPMTKKVKIIEVTGP